MARWFHCSGWNSSRLPIGSGFGKPMMRTRSRTSQEQRLHGVCKAHEKNYLRIPIALRISSRARSVPRQARTFSGRSAVISWSEPVLQHLFKDEELRVF